MEGQLPEEVAAKLEKDISRLDELCLKGSRIVALFDEQLRRGTIDLDGLIDAVDADLELSSEERQLFEDALDYLCNADQRAFDLTEDPSAFLQQTKLQIAKYQPAPDVFHNSGFPGVVMIVLKKNADALQFDLDIEDDVLKTMRELAAQYGMPVTIGKGDEGKFLGKNLHDPKEIGFDNEGTSPFGIIVLNEEACKEHLDNVALHEYLHFIEKIIRRHLHHYFGRADSKAPAANYAHFARLPAESRGKLISALGPLAKQKEDRPFSDTDPEVANTVDTLVEEQTLIDEMRAYAFANGFVVPPQMSTTKLTFDFNHPNPLTRADRSIAERYYKMQLRMLSLWIRGGKDYLQGLSVLACSLSLSQATRLLDGIIAAGTTDMNDDQTRKKIELVRDPNEAFIDYRFGPEVLISPEEVDQYIPKI